MSEHRKLVLTVHIVSSVGWLGAVASFLALALAGLTSHDAQLVRAAYLGTELITWRVILPLACASLLTGIVQGLATTWGLFRHYWVLAKLLLTLVATLLLLVHTRPISRVAKAAAETDLSSEDLRGLRIQLVADAGAALVVLLVNATLSVYKPRGMTRYGRRKQPTSVTHGTETTTRPPRWVRVIWLIVLGLVLVIVMLHLTGHGLGGH